MNKFLLIIKFIGNCVLMTINLCIAYFKIIIMLKKNLKIYKIFILDIVIKIQNAFFLKKIQNMKKFHI